MNNTQTQTEFVQEHTGGWSTGRVAFFVVAIFILQVGFVLLFAERKTPAPRQVETSPHVLFAHEHAKDIALAVEPTIFAWAWPHTFSGHAWFRIVQMDYPPFEWREPPAFLPLRSTQLGNWFDTVINENISHRFEVAEKIASEFITQTIEPTQAALPEKSTLTITGNIAARRLLAQLDLPSWRADDILRPTMVRVVVDASGQVHSATLLAQSGSEQADKFALEIARSAEWEPLPEARSQPLGAAPTGLTSGTMIFWWHTTAGTATNAPVQSN